MTSSLGPGLLSLPRTRVGLGCRFLQDRVCWLKHSEHPLNTSHAGVSRFCVATKSWFLYSRKCPPHPHRLLGQKFWAPLTTGAALTLYCESSQLVPWALRKADWEDQMVCLRTLSPCLRRVNQLRVENT